MAIDNTRTLVFRGIYSLKTTLEQVLRALFSDNTITPSTFLYSNTESATKIQIFRSNPGRVEFYPCIIISAGPHDPDIQAFGMDQEKASEEYNPTSGTLETQTATGYVSIPISMKIFTKRMDDRDQLTDLLVSMLRILGRNRSNKLWWNKIHVHGDSVVMGSDKTPVFMSEITITMHTDYTQISTVDQISLIDKIVEEVIPVINFS